MMTTQQQSADRVKSYVYPLGSPSVDISATASVSTDVTESTVATSKGLGVSSNSRYSHIATSLLPIADRKRKEPASPNDHFDADGSAEASDKQQPSKKSRRELPPHTVAILKGWMLSREHVKHPYPTDEVHATSFFCTRVWLTLIVTGWCCLCGLFCRC